VTSPRKDCSPGPRVGALTAGLGRRWLLRTPGWDMTLVFETERAAHEALAFLSTEGEADWSRAYVVPQDDGV
jgi:hypothetical protein